MVNRKLCDIVGYSYEELMERMVQDIAHPDDLSTDLEYLDQMLAGEIVMYSIKKRYVRDDGLLRMNHRACSARPSLANPFPMVPTPPV